MPQRYKDTKLQIALLFFLILLTTSAGVVNGQQRISFGVHADPVISWFGSDISTIKNDGARSGFNFGLTINKYFSPNYSFSTGINLINAGGRLVSSDTTILEFEDPKSKIVTVLPNQPVVYKVQYLAIPIGLKLQTNEIGYITFFTDLGLDPKVVVGGKADIPSQDIKGDKALNELRVFNLSYHVIAGIEYGLGGNTAFVFGLGFDNNFLDITRDIKNQPVDKISHKLLSFRFGINF
jgi:hypothetical protein